MEQNRWFALRTERICESMEERDRDTETDRQRDRDVKGRQRVLL